MSIGKITEFKLDEGNWSTYCDRVKMYFLVNNVKPELQLPTLIATVGDKTYELMVNLTSPRAPSSLTFDEVVKIVGDHLQPKPSEMAERYKFRQRRQRVGESVANYVAELKRLSRFCGFGNTLEDNMRDQLVCGLANDIIRQRLFAEMELTYTRAITLATALESAEKDAAAVEKPTEVKLSEELNNVSINSSNDRRNGGSSDRCSTCGSVFHRMSECRFRTYVCSSCKQPGHLQRMCPNKRGSVKATRNPKKATRGKRNQTRDSGTGQHYAEPEEGSSSSEGGSSDEEAIYQMSLRNYPAVSVPVLIENRELLMEVDTGSALSCISKTTYNEFFKRVPLESCTVTLRFYNGSKVRPLGIIKPWVKYGDCNKILDLYVIDGGTTSLIGRQWLTELCIKIPTFHNNNNLSVQNKSNEDVFCLLDRYKELFDNQLGRYTGGRATLHVREGARPVYCRARPLPYALKAKVDQELDTMLQNGTIEPVEFSEWATPLVPVSKPNGKLRICADFKVTLNPSLLVDKYPLPRVEELFADLNGGTQFSKIDLSSAYNQIELDDSKKYTIINTHRGLFRYNRLVYGLASSPAIFQRIMTNVMRDIPGVAIFMDDLLITAKNRATHLKTLEKVFERLYKNGLKLNKKKCIFFADSVSYLGYVIDKNGIHTDPGKVKAIVDLPRPSSVSELRSFLGMVNFYAKFIKNLSSLLAPLYNLLKKSTRWNWNAQCDSAFNEVKKMLTSADVLLHYNPNEQLIVTCDASSQGVGAVLSQYAPDGQERPISYASRALAPAERQYSQIQREALAIIFAVKKFHQYLYGRNFLLRTDHKPLVTILGPKTGIPNMVASRLQRWAIILSAYSFDIEYVRTDKNSADALSRLPLPSNEKNDKFSEPEQTFLHFARDALLLDYQELKKETKKDPVLGRIVSYVQDGWPIEVDSNEFQPYYNRRKELYLELGCLMWGHRVVIPETCRSRVLKELHETHLGIVKMKGLARSYVWWAGLDEEIEALCRGCDTCAALAAAPPAHSPQPWPWCSKPWRRLHIDFLGPINDYKFLIVVDATSKWVEAFKMTNTNATEVIKKLRCLFSQFGLPKMIVSDNGPPFSSSSFKLFLESNRIEQCFSAPYHPSSNGAAENAVKLCKSAIKKAIKDNVDVETALHRYLLLYRNTEHATTGDSPARILQGRNLRTRLDAFKPDREMKVLKKHQDQAEKSKGSHRELQVGDPVYLKDFSKKQSWTPGKVLQKLGSTDYKVRDSVGRETHRHIDQLKRRSLAVDSSFSKESRCSQKGITSGSTVTRQLLESLPNTEGYKEADPQCSSKTNVSPSAPSVTAPPAAPSARPEPLSPPKGNVSETTEVSQTLPSKRTRYPAKRYGFEID